MSRLLDNLLLFGRLLRRAGIDIHPGRMMDVVEALGHVDLAVRDEVYHTCRALLVHRQETMSFLGFPLLRYIDINDSEEVIRAIRLTDDRVPIDLVLHTPGGLVWRASRSQEP